ncbi:MAG: PSP1 domain-containing protein, partial [Dehalococcoidia bacterium]
MQNVVGVRFQEAGKIYYFSPAGFEDVEVGEYVVVETSRGLEVCRVIIAPSQVVNAELSETLKPIVRVAYQEDLERMQILKARAEEDIATARATVNRMALPIKVVSAAYNLDGTRLTIYFNPAEDGRVDLRDLLRDLQAELNCQVQLRQVGPRDQAKAIGGYGICGRRLCCSSWLTAFPAISIKMAKEQNQPLNPSKISGQCGRLLCCLSYENDMYRQLKAELPRAGTLVSTPSGDARVVGVNALRQVVTLQMANFQVVELPASALAMERGVVRVIALPESDASSVAIDETPAPEPPREER